MSWHYTGRSPVGSPAIGCFVSTKKVLRNFSETVSIWDSIETVILSIEQGSVDHYCAAHLKCAAAGVAVYRLPHSGVRSIIIMSKIIRSPAGNKTQSNVTMTTLKPSKGQDLLQN